VFSGKVPSGPSHHLNFNFPTRTAGCGLLAETEACKNALEEYVYDLRNKTGDIWAPFGSEPEGEDKGDMCCT